jgi:hypothetical protein
VVPTSGGQNGGAVDCTIACSFFTSSPGVVSSNNLYTTVVMSTDFKIQFEYTNPVLHGYPIISSILDLVDATSGQSLLALSMPWTTSTVLAYNGIVLERWGPNLGSDCRQSQWTTITIVFRSGKLSIQSSANPGWIASYTASATVDTTSRVYNLYLSRLSDYSAGGSIRNMVISGMLFCSLPSFFCSGRKFIWTLHHRSASQVREQSRRCR